MLRTPAPLKGALDLTESIRLGHAHTFAHWRPEPDLGRCVVMYQHGLGLVTVGQFEDHEGLSGVILACPNSAYHFEFTFCHTRSVAPAPTPADLYVLYFPELEQWRKARDRC